MTTQPELIHDNYERTIEQLEDRIETLQDKHGDLVTAIDAVKQYRDVQDTVRGLAPITEGIFVHADFHADEGFKVNAGEGVLVDKEPSEVISLLEERIDDIETAIDEAQDELISLYNEIDAL